MASAPPVTPMPYCRDWSSLLVVALLSESSVRLVMTLRSHSSTWIGRTKGAFGGCGCGVWAGLSVGGWWCGCAAGSSLSRSLSTSLSNCVGSVGPRGPPAWSTCGPASVLWGVRRMWSRVQFAMASPPCCRAASSLHLWIHLYSSSSSASCCVVLLSQVSDVCNIQLQHSERVPCMACAVSASSARVQRALRVLCFQSIDLFSGFSPSS